jgi:hypothetical protein
VVAWYKSSLHTSTLDASASTSSGGGLISMILDPCPSLGLSPLAALLQVLCVWVLLRVSLYYTDSALFVAL